MPEIEESQAEEAVQEPVEEESTQAETEPEPAAGEEESEEVADAEAPEESEDAQAEGTDDDWLPDEQKKEYPLDVLLEYASKRFPNLSKELITKDAGVRDLLKGKLDADIYLKQRTAEEQPEEDADDLANFLAEDGLEVTEPEPAAQPTTAAQPDPQAAHYQRVDSLVSGINPKVTEELGRNLLASMGVNTDPKYIDSLRAKLMDGNTTPAQRTEIQSYLETVGGAAKVGGTLARGAMDLFLTALPEVMPDLIEQIYPGTQLRYQRGVCAEAWDNLSQVAGKDSKPLYPNLPRFGTPEYKKVVQKVEKGMGLPEGGLGALSFNDANGRPLSVERQLQATMRLIARASSGQKISPAVVSQALQTGATKEREKSARIARGRALGSGQPTSSKGTTSENDDIFGPGIEEYKRRGG